MGNKKRTGKHKDSEKTKRIKTVKGDNKKDKKTKKKHAKLKLAIKIIFAIILLCIIIGVGVVAGIFFGLFGDDLKITADDLNIKMENSVLIDINGNEVATLNGDENREVISLSEMGEYLPQAFVAIEDKRFYEHNGVDIQRTLGAILKFATGNSSYGGSTITQQLIKNATGDNDKDWKRKVREIAKAFQIEREMSKDQILESYLNTIPLGGGSKNVYGVKVASNYYFDKEPSELTLAQAAYIAGINHSPNVYNPFKDEPNTEKINSRTKTVLNEMLDQAKITQEQYDEAIAEVDAGLAFKEGNITSNNSLTQNEEAAVKQAAKQYASEHDLTYDIALQRIQSGGYKIYITEDKKLQDIVDDTYTNSTSWITTKTVTEKDENGNSYKTTIQLQSAMVVIDHKTGYVVAARGVLGEKTPWGINRVTTSTHQPGSSIKPLAVISPSLQEGLITAGTVIDDTPVTYGSYSPHNDKAGYYGLMNIRYILRVSRNIPEVKMMRKLTPAKSIEYLKSFGISTLSGDEGLSLALGAVDGGVSPLEMAAAYATIANGGVYIEPTFYIKVEDQNGNVVMQKEQETHRVISEQNAWIVQSLLTEPTGTGLTGTDGATGTRARVTGMQTCGKTGTTNDTTATWFCGFTPYYSAAMYFGFDTPKEGSSKYLPGSGTVASRWGGIMNKIHSGLASASFTKPSGIVTASVCKDSGLLATSECEQDQRGSRVYTEYYVKGTAPTKSCTTHVKLKICKETGKIANEYCTDVEEKVFITRDNSDTDTSWQQAADAQYMAPTETCTTHTSKPDTEKPVITINDVTKDTIEIKVNGQFTIPTATATDNIDGDITKNITTQIKKDGTVVEKIDTSKAGTYTITYTVEDTAKNTATKTITVKIVSGEEQGNTENTTQNNTTNTNQSNTANNTAN
jgi:penicillin-binding protein 1A